MKFSLIYIYSPSRLALCNTRAELKLSTKKISQKVQSNSHFNFLNFFIIHEILSPTCIWALPLKTTVVLCSSRAKLKPSIFQVSHEVQTNPNLIFCFLFVNVHEILSSTFFETPYNNPTSLVTPYHVVTRAK
jgi:hypothetical protein